jgi:hypothetical protein
MRNVMTGTRRNAVGRRGIVAGALVSGALLALPGIAQAQVQAPAQPQPGLSVTDTETDNEAVRQLMVLASQNALASLGQPNGFLTSNVARFGLPVLFASKVATSTGPLAQAAFRQQLIQRLNLHAEAGARGATPTVAQAARKLPIVNAAGILRGHGPTAATSAMRLEMGSGLVNALRIPIEQALIVAQDPIIAEAIAALPGVTLGDVAHAIAISADNGIWYEIGSAEAKIRANPAATGNAALAAALAATPATPTPQP